MSMPPLSPHEEKRFPLAVRIAGVLFFTSLVIFLSAYFYAKKLNEPSPTFPVDADIVIEGGGTMNSVVAGLSDAGVVQSALYLYILLSTTYESDFVQAGTYRFPYAMTTEEIAYAITHGEHQSPLIRVTFPEGFRVQDFFTYFKNNENGGATASLQPHEGYLFPDTYFITPGMTTEEMVAIMRANFEKKLSLLRTSIAASGLSEHDTIVFASIIEREAKDAESKHLVSGILHNRLKEGMPLQVDATLDYLLDKESSELTIDDLKLDSPYNTYVYRGLPPTPISNPGLEAIEAVLNPTESTYLYYLTAPDGTFYYAESFEEHKRNKARYLR